MKGFIYFIVIILANTVGAISGMGGGVIIKPVLDMIGADPLTAISFYSAVAVFTMSIVSTIRQLQNNLAIQWIIAFFVSIGAVIGGVTGNITFDFLRKLWQNDQQVQLVQIVLTVITLVFAFVYSKMDGRHFNLKNKTWYVLVGFILGFVASLLGIGGGPINVALLMLCFGVPIKEATVYSIITIFFSQLAKLIAIGTTSGFSQFDLKLLWFIIPAAVIGGFIGAKLSGVLPSKKVTIVYQGVIILVLLINIYNGVRIFV